MVCPEPAGARHRAAIPQTRELMRLSFNFEVQHIPDQIKLSRYRPAA